MTIDFDSLNIFQKFPPNIPWYNPKKGVYAVIVQPAALPEGSTDLLDPELLDHKAADAFIEFYLPEFYPYIYGGDAKRLGITLPDGGYRDTYATLRTQIKASIKQIKSDPKSAATAPKYLYESTAGSINFKDVRLGLYVYDADAETKERVLDELKSRVKGDQDCPPPPYEERELPSYSSGFPPFPIALEFFTAQQELLTKSVGHFDDGSFNLGLAPQTSANLREILTAYHTDIQRFPAPLRIPLDLSAVKEDVTGLISLLTNMARRDMNLSGIDLNPFSTNDHLSIDVTDKYKVQSITYSAGPGVMPRPLKIGYFSLVKHNPALNDEWVMITLLRAQEIVDKVIERGADGRSGRGLTNLLGFIHRTYGPLLRPPGVLYATPEEIAANPELAKVKAAAELADLPLDLAAPVPPGIDPHQYHMVFKGTSHPLDVLNPSKLVEGISTFMTSPQAAQMQQAMQDPKMLAQMYNSAAQEKFSATFPLKDMIDEVIKLVEEAKGVNAAAEERTALLEEKRDAQLELEIAEETGTEEEITHWRGKLEDAEEKLSADRAEGGPASEARDVLEIVNKVLEMLGIADLINEALICLTMGSSFSLARINHAIDFGFSIAEFIEDYEKPTIPPPLIVIPDWPKLPAIFNITGDPPLWQQILDIVLQTLAEVAFDIIKGICELIKHNCDNLADRDIGALDAADAMKDNTVEPINLPNMQDLIDDAFRKHGLDQDRGFNYISAVSGVLSPLEICRLYMSPADVPDETIRKIAVFNKNYSDAVIKKMQSRNQILSLFNSMSQLCDISRVCNEYIDQDVRASVENFCLKEADKATLADQESIQKLADYLNNGVPVEIPPIDFLCPENDKFVPNPIVSRIIPQLFDTLIENVRMQFAYSIEATRTTILEPQVDANPNPAVIAALTHTNALPDPPEIDTAFLTILTTIFEKLRDPDFEIDPAVCPDIDMSKFGTTIDEFIEALPILNSILQDALAASEGELDQLEASVGNLKDNIDSGGANVPYVTYVFPTQFYNHFRAMAHQGPPSYENIQGTVPDVWLTTTNSPGGKRTYYSKMLLDRTTKRYGRLRMQYQFLSPINPGGSPRQVDPIRLEFYSNNDISSGRRPAARLGYPSKLLPGVKNGWININVADDSFTPLFDWAKGGTSPDGLLASYGSESDFNPYIFNFTYPLQKQLESLGPLNSTNKKYLQNKLQKQVYPTAFNGIIKRTFAYIQRNGIFDMVGLNRLNLFKDNTNCEPSQVGDLLDVRGILNQVKEEFLQSSCNDDGTPQELVEAALKYALLQLLIQVCIVEILIKNIFVFSAFRFDEVFEKKVFTDLILTSLTSELTTRLGLAGGTVKEYIYEHFETKLAREPVIEAGGIAHSYDKKNIVPYLTPEADMEKMEFSKLVRFLVEERFGHTYQACGQTVTTMGSINNVLRSAGASKTFDEIFIKEILGIYGAPYGKRNAPMKHSDGRLVFVKYVYWDAISNWNDVASSEILVPWDARELEPVQTEYDAAYATMLAAVPTDPSTYTADALREAAIEQFVETHGERPVMEVPRHKLSIQNVFGSAGPGAMPIRTTTAVDFIDMIELTDGPRPSFENVKCGYKLIFNFPSYRGASYQAADWDQSNSPFVQSFRPGAARNVIQTALRLQGRAVGMDSILDSAMSDLDAENEGPQILGEMLTVDIRAIGEFDPNQLADIANTSPPPSDNNGPGIPSMGAASSHNPNDEATLSTETKIANIRRFQKTNPDKHVRRILDNQEYQRFITQTFNPELAMMIPVLYNLGLTSFFFPGIEKDFETTKQVILDLFNMVSRTQRPTPLANQDTATALNNELASDGQSNLDMNIREFILKAIRETPIKILKGVVELIDPHVAISKIIRDITGELFGNVTRIIDTGIDYAESTQPDASPMLPILKAITGEDLLALGFCGLNTLNAQASDKIPGGIKGMDAPLLGPRMTLNGIDFTGTISGLFMMPPTPFGIIYILLMLLDQMNNEEAEADTDENSQANVSDGQNSNVC